MCLLSSVVMACATTRTNHAQFHELNIYKMPGIKVDANISFMFKEWPNFIDRYKAASEAGYFIYLLVIDTT